MARKLAHTDAPDLGSQLQPLESGQLAVLLAALARNSAQGDPGPQGVGQIAPVFHPPDHANGPHYENGNPTSVAGGATLTDEDSPDFDGGSLTVSVNNATQYDQLDVFLNVVEPFVVRT